MQALNRTNKKIDKRGWLKATILIIAWILIFSLAKDFWQVKKGFSRIEEASVRLAEEEERNIMLKDKLAKVMTEEYKERVIREQLNMQKVGEVVAVLPKNGSLTSQVSDRQEDTKKNWEKWWALLK